MLVLKGAVIVLAFVGFLSVLMFLVAICAESDDDDLRLTDEDIQQMRFNYAHYEEDDIQ